MKPSFALNLAHDGITLLHRGKGGWTSVGTAEIEDAAIGETLGFLRATALGLEPSGLSSKLILPNSQILYTTVNAPGPSTKVRRRQIMEALEGMTPYDVADLVFDWSGTGDEVQVAVVARETLEEAQAFAAEHRLNPVSWVASPEPGSFAGEPFFGQTDLADTLIPKGEKLERDQDPILVSGVPNLFAPGSARDKQTGDGEAVDELAAPVVEEPADMELADQEDPAPEPTEAAAPAEESAETADEPSAEAELEVEAEVEPDPEEPDPKNQPEIPPASDPQPEPEPLGEPGPQPEAEPEQAPEINPEPTPEIAPPPGPELSADAEVPVAEAKVADQVTTDPEDEAAGETAADETEEVPEASFAEMVEVDDTDDPEPAGIASPPPAQTPPSVSVPPEITPGMISDPRIKPGEERPRPLPAFSSRRIGVSNEHEGDLVSGTPARLGIVTGKGSDVPRPPVGRGGPTAPLRLQKGKADGQSRGGKLLAASRKLRQAQAAATASAAAAMAMAKSQKPQSDDADTKSPLINGAKPPFDLTPRSDKSKVVPPPPEGSKPVIPASAPGQKSTGGPLNDPEALTIFGARKSGAVGGKPRHFGLILTGILLLLLAIVAIWSSGFGGDTTVGEDGADGVAQTVAIDLQSPEPPTAEASTEGAADVSEDLAELEEEPELEGEPITLADEPLVPETAEPADEPLPEPTIAAADSADTLPEAVASENPDLQLAAPSADDDPQGEPQDEILLASLDSTVATTKRIALETPPAIANDRPMVAPPPPAPFGTEFEFQDNGLVRATPDGALSPDGILVYAGKPPSVPPARPAELAPALAQPEVAEPATPTGDDVTNGAEGTLIETVEGTAPAEEPLVIVNDPTLAGARPRARPEDKPSPDDDAALEVGTPTDFATVLRPRARPSEIAEAATARIAAAAAAQSEAEAKATELASAEEGGLGTSLRPRLRPKDFSQGVTAALAAAVASEPQPAARSGNSEVVESDDEPEVVVAAPKIPTRASVAKQATMKNVLNLSKLNLIGVSGSAKSRHALVRLPNGKIKRMKVGDKLDGGRITAIGERELRYEKRGKSYTLSLPKA